MPKDAEIRYGEPEPHEYDISEELYRGCLGALLLGKAVRGHHAGRKVMLRELPSVALAQFERTVDAILGVAHPRLIKLLGLVSLHHRPYLISEHVDGISLGELQRLTAALTAPVLPAVALRIAFDALLAASAASEELTYHTNEPLGHCLFPDTLWVASFGETLLSDAGVARLLATTPARASTSTWISPEAQQGSDWGGTSNVYAAGVMIWELVTGQSLPNDDLAVLKSALESSLGPELPTTPRVLQIVGRALANDPRERFRGPGEMIRAIQGLPSSLLASDAQVQATIEPFLPHAERNGILEFAGTSTVDPWDTPTRTLRSRQFEPRSDAITIRPAPAPAKATSRPSGTHPIDDELDWTGTEELD
jgi:serine/threonine-protein kinase